MPDAISCAILRTSEPDKRARARTVAAKSRFHLASGWCLQQGAHRSQDSRRRRAARSHEPAPISRSSGCPVGPAPIAGAPRQPADPNRPRRYEETRAVARGRAGEPAGRVEATAVSHGGMVIAACLPRRTGGTAQCGGAASAALLSRVAASVPSAGGFANRSALRDVHCAERRRDATRRPCRRADAKRAQRRVRSVGLGGLGAHGTAPVAALVALAGGSVRTARGRGTARDARVRQGAFLRNPTAQNRASPPHPPAPRTPTLTHTRARKRARANTNTHKHTNTQTHMHTHAHTPCPFHRRAHAHAPIHTQAQAQAHTPAHDRARLAQARRSSSA